MHIRVEGNAYFLSQYNNATSLNNYLFSVRLLGLPLGMIFDFNNAKTTINPFNDNVRQIQIKFSCICEIHNIQKINDCKLNIKEIFVSASEYDDIKYRYMDDIEINEINGDMDMPRFDYDDLFEDLITRNQNVNQHGYIFKDDELHSWGIDSRGNPPEVHTSRRNEIPKSINIPPKEFEEKNGNKRKIFIVKDN